MTSFDIESLYTNIPLSETINIILDLLFDANLPTVLGLCTDTFKKLLELSVLNSFFLFNKVLKEGLGMGLPQSPTFANVFLCFHEQRWLNNCPPEFSPVFYRRYMDDTFILFREQAHAPLFLNYLNKQHQNINFTMECENNNSLPFLDVLITRVDNKFCTSVYRKPTFSGLGISFFSFCSSRFKINSIKTLLFRAYNICSNYRAIDLEARFLRSFFIDNGFPTKLFDSLLRKFLDSKFQITSTNPVCNVTKIYFPFLYFGYQSDKLKKELDTLLSKFIKCDFSVNLVFVNKLTIGSLFKYKDSLPKQVKSSVVYRYCCRQCRSEYVGSSTRSLYIRAAEHAGRSFRTNKVLGSPSHSNVREHAFNCKVDISLDDFDILGMCNDKNSTNLRILESLHIFKRKPVINNMQTAYPLNLVTK